MDFISRFPNVRRTIYLFEIELLHSLNHQRGGPEVEAANSILDFYPSNSS